MLESRIRPRCQRYMKRLVLDRRGVVQPTSHIQRVAEREGITDLTILKTRSDKVIARGSHPDRGNVAIKASDPFLNAIPASAGLHIDSTIASRPAPFLPAVHAFGLGYSVSEWIDGRHVHDLDPADCDPLPFLAFVEQLHEWCRSQSEQRPLETGALMSIIRLYVETTIRRMRYRSAANCIRAVARFRQDEKRLAGYVDEMISLSPALGLLETPMFSDVQTWNVLLRKRDNRLMLVDYEALRPGNVLFDIVFWLCSLVIHGAPRPLVEAVARHVFSPQLMPGREDPRFFRAFALYVTETYLTIDGCGRDEIKDRQEILFEA